MALEDDDAQESAFVVFIEAKKPLSQQEVEDLGRLGVSAASPGVSLVTASLNQDGVDRISELSNVRSIKLSQRLSMRVGAKGP